MQDLVGLLQIPVCHVSPFPTPTGRTSAERLQPLLGRDQLNTYPPLGTFHRLSQLCLSVTSFVGLSGASQ